MTREAACAGLAVLAVTGWGLAFLLIVALVHTGRALAQRYALEQERALGHVPPPVPGPGTADDFAQVAGTWSMRGER